MYEYIPNGTVADHHGHQATPGSLTWPTRMSIAIETACALEMKYIYIYMYFFLVCGRVVLKAIVYYYYYYFWDSKVLYPKKKKLSRRFTLNYVVHYCCNIIFQIVRILYYF